MSILSRLLTKIDKYIVEINNHQIKIPLENIALLDNISLLHILLIPIYHI